MDKLKEWSEENHHYGCGVKCMSYVTKRSASQIRKMTKGNYPDGIEIISILKKLGFKTITPFRPRILEPHKHIAITPSLNSVGEFHFCVLWYKNGLKVYDPIKSKELKRYVSRNKKKLQPNEHILTSWASIIEVYK